MDNFKKNITLQIGSVTLPIVVDSENEVLLRQAASFVDQQINERTHKNTIVKPLDITAIMVALSMASKLLVAQKTIEDGIQEQLKPHLENLRAEIKSMDSYADDILSRLELT